MYLFHKEVACMTEKEIIEGVLSEFEGLAKHPRPSHHEKNVSDYIVARLAELGITAKQDSVYNIVADVPATKGFEKAPLTVLQGHMDMVCVAKPGVSYDPLKDPIRLVREGNILRADGTSLGADDGIAVAVALYLIQQKINHGPLRLIFTVDEETGMTGATNLDAAHVKDAKYVINCDSESIDVICVASAGSTHMHFMRQLHREVPAGDVALAVRVHRLLGGHSGEVINEGRGNAIKAVSSVLRRLADKGADYRLADFSGGIAANAIPADATAIIVIASKDKGLVENGARSGKEFRLTYEGLEDKAVFEVTPSAMAQSVFSKEDTEAVVDLISLLHCGVFSMNRAIPTLPDLSSSLGTIVTTDKDVAIQYFPRSSADARLREFLLSMPVIARLTGTDVHIDEPMPAWTENMHSRLQPLMAGVYEELMGKKPRIEAMHGGLETGYLYAMNPDLDIVAVGPETHDIHSADECVELDTVAQLVQVIAGTLEKLAQL